MNQLDFDRAFPQTPDYIETAIELGLRKGKNRMKFRNKLIAAGSIAAMFAVVITAALAMIPQRPATPDILTQPPLKPEAEIAMVYSTEGADYYHLEKDCSGLENAVSMNETEAVQMGKKPCPVCIPLRCNGHDGEEIELICYSQGGKYFHREQVCQEGEYPLKGEYFAVTKAFPEKEPCAVCFPEGIEECVHGRAFVIKEEEAVHSPLPVAEPEEETEMILLPETYDSPVSEETSLKQDKSAKASSTVFAVYGASGKYYHKERTCGDQENRREITLDQAKHENLSACPYCYGDFVYYTENGTYYHSDEHCQGMMNAKAHTRSNARENRKSPCPICLMVYCTKGGRYFHLLPDCIGMQGAKLRSLEEAYALDKTRCPVCLSPETVYATQKGAYFHAFSACSGMEGAQPTDPESAWNSGKGPCPVCITGNALNSDVHGLSNAANAQKEIAVSFPQHHDLFQKAFGKSINNLIPGYHFDHEAVYQDPELGNGRIWKLKSDTNPNEEAIPGCWLLEKDERYDAYRLLVNLSTSNNGNRRNNADAFMDGAMCTLYGKSYPLDDIPSYVDIHSFVAEQTGAQNADEKLELMMVMVQFSRDDEVSGYDALWVYDEKEYYTLRVGFTSDGKVNAEIIAGNALV